MPGKPSRETTRLKAQAVVAALGFTAGISALESWGLHVAERRLMVDTAMATDEPGPRLRGRPLPAGVPAARRVPGHAD